MATDQFGVDCIAPARAQPAPGLGTGSLRFSLEGTFSFWRLICGDIELRERRWVRLFLRERCRHRLLAESTSAAMYCRSFARTASRATSGRSLPAACGWTARAR